MTLLHWNLCIFFSCRNFTFLNNELCAYERGTVNDHADDDDCAGSFFVVFSHFLMFGVNENLYANLRLTVFSETLLKILS